MCERYNRNSALTRSVITRLQCIVDWRIAGGRLLQMDRLETAQLRGPYFDVLVCGTVRLPCHAEHRHWRPVLAATGTHISAR